MPSFRRLRGITALALLACLLAAPTPAAADTREVIGRSVQNRPIVLFGESVPDPALGVLVIGAIHGDEPAGIRIARKLIAGAAPAGTELLIVPTINPDGVAADTRGNAHGVDLNRNFPFRWQPLGGGEYSGPGPLSEPETRTAHSLIRSEQPDLTIWFHQPFGLIDRPDGNPFAARRFARLVGLPLVRLRGPYPGSASRTQNHAFPQSTAFVAELPGRVSGALVRRAAAAVRALATELASPAIEAGRSAD